MPASSTFDVTTLIGREPERLTPAEHSALSGKWIALEVYTPQRLPLKLIEAAGDSVEECMHRLRDRGLDPGNFEFCLMRPPY